MSLTMSTPGLLKHIEQKLLTPRPDCKIWPGAVDRGYGRIFVDGNAKRVHRVAWELKNGPIPDGLTIDHLCRIRSCVNTENMELVTQAENASRANDFRVAPVVSVARAKRPPVTHCKRGHEFTPENTVVRPTGSRRCLACDRARKHERKAD